MTDGTKERIRRFKMLEKTSKTKTEGRRNELKWPESLTGGGVR